MACRVAFSLAAGAVATDAVALRGGADMQPEVVARTLVSVEDEWKAQASVFLECSNATSGDSESVVDCAAAPKAFEKSCDTVVNSVVQGSSGDRYAVREYLDTVCSQSMMQNWHQTQCRSLAAAVNGKMTGDSYENRVNLNVKGLCTGFWSHFLQMEQQRVVQEQEQSKEEDAKAAAAKAKADEEDAKATAEADAKAKADEEAKAKADAEVAAKVEEEAKADADAKAEAEAKAAEAKAAEVVKQNATVDEVDNATVQTENSTIAAVVSTNTTKTMMLVEQDPCAGCDEQAALKHQVCAKDYGNACKKDAAGNKADISCCMRTEKHKRCLSCASNDCAHGTCTVNKKYYNERTLKK